jgi:hypothetical protein
LDGVHFNADYARLALHNCGIEAFNVSVKYGVREVRVDQRVVTNMNTEMIQADVVYGICLFYAAEHEVEPTRFRSALQSCNEFVLHYVDKVDTGFLGPIDGLIRTHYHSIEETHGLYPYSVVFVPHMLTAALSEYPRGTSVETISLNANSRLNRMPRLPIPDADALQVVNGTEIMMHGYECSSTVPLSALTIDGTSGLHLNFDRADAPPALKAVSYASDYKLIPEALLPGIARSTARGSALRILDSNHQDPFWLTLRVLFTAALPYAKRGVKIIGALMCAFLGMVLSVWTVLTLTPYVVAFLSACAEIFLLSLQELWPQLLTLLMTGLGVSVYLWRRRRSRRGLRGVPTLSSVRVN